MKNRPGFFLTDGLNFLNRRKMAYFFMPFFNPPRPKNLNPLTDEGSNCLIIKSVNGLIKKSPKR